MTAGHGGEQHGGAPGRTDGGPGEGSGYAPAPPPPPPSYSPYPSQGYGPAPGGWGPPPQPLERPGTVRFGLGAIIASLILSAIALVYQGLNFDSILDAATSQLDAQQSQAVAQLGPDFERTLIVVTIAVGAVWLCLQLLFVWFAWQGRNWARIVLWVIAGLGVVGGVFSFSANSYLPGFLQGLSICEWVLTVAAIVLLALKPSNEWYRYRKWQRSVGQG